MYPMEEHVVREGLRAKRAAGGERRRRRGGAALWGTLGTATDDACGTDDELHRRVSHYRSRAGDAAAGLWGGRTHLLVVPIGLDDEHANAGGRGGDLPWGGLARLGRLHRLLSGLI